MATLNDKNVGDIVKINENDTAVNFIIVHKGKPSSLYDSSCDGVWLLRETALDARTWDSGNINDYENSDIHAYIDGIFLNSIDSKIRAEIKSVKIPFLKGTGDEGHVQSGTEGLSCKIFLLGGYEVGLAESSGGDFPFDGAKLSYFSTKNSRICKDRTGKAVYWWLRSAQLYDHEMVWRVSTSGTSSDNRAVTVFAVRPAFVLPYDLTVSSDGTVSMNTPPTITSDKTGNLGTLANGFTCNYSVNDVDTADSLTVTLTLDDVQKSKFTATKGTQYTYSLTGNEWLKVTNGSHTFKISVTDGNDTVESTATFSRSVNSAFISLETSLEADDVIRACSVYIKGSLPADTDLLCEVTNNGNDTEPVWEDCTDKVKSEMPYLFQNKTAENGFAFNFRVSAERGTSGVGGYITEISGGFE